MVRSAREGAAALPTWLPVTRYIGNAGISRTAFHRLRSREQFGRGNHRRSAASRLTHGSWGTGGSRPSEEMSVFFVISLHVADERSLITHRGALWICVNPLSELRV